jgi:CPA2 family monovalent cation:H+ antiporter-2
VLLQVAGAQVEPRIAQTFLVVAVLSIAATPALFALGCKLTSRRAPAATQLEVGTTGGHDLHDHVIVVGLGPVGRNVSSIVRELGIPVVGLEMNAATVKEWKVRGWDVIHGDATRPSVIKAARIERARVLVVAVNDANVAQRAAHLARLMAPHLHVIARVQFLSDVPAIIKEVDEVVPRELETSVEVLVRVLRRFLVPEDEVGKHIEALRRESGVEKVAPVPTHEAATVSAYVPGMSLQVFAIAADAVAAGKSLADLALRRHTGCTVIAVRRGAETLTAIGPETTLQSGDAVVLIGPVDRLADASCMFHARGDVPTHDSSILAEPTAKTLD